MAGVVTFNWDTFVAQYPEFAGCAAPQGKGWFNRATLQFANDSCNPAFNDGNMEALLYLLTAHIGWLTAPRDPNGNPAATGAPAPAVVGRISSASQGSVSVQTEWNGGGTPSEDYYTQTRYGIEYWQATAKYRSFGYAAQPVGVAYGYPIIFPRGYR